MGTRAASPGTVGAMAVDQVAGSAAEHDDEASAEAFDPAVVDPAVDLIAELAGDGAALE